MLGGKLLLCLEIIKSQFQNFLSLMISQQCDFLSSVIILNGFTGWIVFAHVFLGMISRDTKMAQWLPFRWQRFISFSGCDIFLVHMAVSAMDCRRPLTIPCIPPTLVRVNDPQFSLAGPNLCPLSRHNYEQWFFPSKNCPTLGGRLCSYTVPREPGADVLQWAYTVV